MNTGGHARPTGTTAHQVERDLGELQFKQVPLGWRLRNMLRHRRREIPQEIALRLLGGIRGVILARSELQAKVYRPKLAALDSFQLLKLRELLTSNMDLDLLPAHFGGQVLNYGTISRRVVTTVGVGFIVDAFQNLVEVENMKYHGYGTGSTAEASGDTALVTELTTEYVSNGIRPTGTTTEGASANIYRTVATLSPDTGGTIAIVEHGIFSATSAGVLLDRSVFSAINLVAGSDSLQTQYDLTFSAGG